MSPVSVNARRAAARIELFLASAVSRLRLGGALDPAAASALSAGPGVVVAALAMKRPSVRNPTCSKYAHTLTIPAMTAEIRRNHGARLGQSATVSERFL